MEGGGFKIDLFLFVYVVTFNVFWKLLNWIVDKKKRKPPKNNNNKKIEIYSNGHKYMRKNKLWVF